MKHVYGVIANGLVYGFLLIFSRVMIPDDEAMSGMRMMLVLNRIDEWWCLRWIDEGHMTS
jgi:hypothetical protein